MKHNIPGMNSNHIFSVTEHENSQRLDVFLLEKLPAYSRTHIQKLIESDCVTVNGLLVKKSFLLRLNDSVFVNTAAQPVPCALTESMQNELQKMAINVIYEHEDFLIVNKAAGIMTHRPRTIRQDLTVVEWLAYHYQLDMSPSERPGIVHRLDKDTSGIMILAKNNYAQSTLSDLFKNRAIKKTYHALVVGHPEKSGVIDIPIGRDPVTRNRMAVNGIKARQAKTYFRVLTYFQTTSLIELHPHTGRTHQIRVHCASIGHSLLGDILYGSPSPILPRHALHAAGISFTYKNQEYAFSIEAPHDFNQAVCLQKIYV